MEKKERISKLNDIKDQQKDNPAMSGIKIKYNGSVQKFNAFRIPLDCLIFNKYNGRIARFVKSYEKQYHHELDAENPDDEKVIENFLWESNKPKNRITMNNIVMNEQQKYGIVTSDGRIIDGNRRAMILKRIHKNRDEWRKKGHDVGHSEYFTAVILPGDMSPKDIMELETTYQMGEDEKLSYDAIEKYLKCKDLKQAGFNEGDIALMMSETKEKIVEWLEIMKLMDDYLRTKGYEGIYTQLEDSEDLFINLNNTLKRLISGSSQVNWGYNNLNISRLKAVCFDYIRAKYEGKEYRNIIKLSKKDGVFCNKEAWDQFNKEHKESIDKVSKEEKTVEEYIKENPGVDLTRLLKERDSLWKKQVEDNMKENLGKTVAWIQNKNKANEPIELLTKILSIIDLIDPYKPTFYEDTKVEDLVNAINSATYDYKKIIKEKRKSK
ncbi:hypothetical protein [Clostridium sp. BNL1100]|uniref:hypothetical protein n=1 Tax=Clostridium sp. BNL1100 TaxID=755731 RepID=UPI00024A77A8|nr:hypothetical protein [Clostridium sp. BNL1100]AEY64803.1 hypothetical protein Clo1100_0523 [Clostridium sp. BNL1100]